MKFVTSFNRPLFVIANRLLAVWHPMYVMQVKTPARSTNEWDLSKVIATVPASIAVRPLDAGGYPLVK